ncbi:hypothetical protein AGDE_01453 [Angomonas deanei]|uniref:Large ribosomal subunit protein mL43 n=1 Tax=Angomonas deanei TaxID=59799 RepID=A0A7G2C273_9TRYP|nr:hypothetical protein AGDE_01453 [Angomonas deanei]CAD2213830.1 hypothetical protein, conserved [Angomonas deanei]|eukprot:EPY42470.1 hypothetical protein AGDE_01453 [Angomonas deanei]
MSRNGELCLQKVIISYNPSRGDPATRQLLATYLPQFKRQYPSVVIDLRPRHWPETAITGVYRDGSERAYRTKYLSSLGIHSRLHRLVNEGNDSNVPFSAGHLHQQRRSVQGPWNPLLWHYEGGRRRQPPARWDRSLTKEEWQYYTTQYAAQMRSEEETIAAAVRRYTELPDAATREVQRRWRAHVLPQLQTDLAHNLQHLKRSHRRGTPPAPVDLAAYQLFSTPDHTVMAQDAVDVLRRREAQSLEEWWRQRREQLQPPE